MIEEETEIPEHETDQAPAMMSERDAEAVTGGFDVGSVVDQINNAVKTELANIEREMSEGAEISDAEIQIRLKGIVSRLR